MSGLSVIYTICAIMSFIISLSLSHLASEYSDNIIYLIFVVPIICLFVLLLLSLIIDHIAIGMFQRFISWLGEGRRELKEKMMETRENSKRKYKMIPWYIQINYVIEFYKDLTFIIPLIFIFTPGIFIGYYLSGASVMVSLSSLIIFGFIINTVFILVLMFMAYSDNYLYETTEKLIFYDTDSTITIDKEEVDIVECGRFNIKLKQDGIVWSIWLYNAEEVRDSIMVGKI